MNPRKYKPVDERHRVLSVIEQFWDKHPSDEIMQLLERIEATKETTDSQVCRRINKRL